MKVLIPRLLLVPILLGLINSFALAEKIKIKDLPEKFRQWLEEEVCYIITSVEKDVFLELKTDRERELFVKAFWKQRDPTPGTEENEFRQEHYRRLQYANRMFRAAGKPGWKTDRGKAYIILGEPKDIRIFQGTDSYFPAELWSYQGLEYQGLPQAFHLLFFQKNRAGEYILYDPAIDGPWNLMPKYEGEIGNYLEAYEILSNMEPELASASLSLIPGESLINVPSLASSMLIRTLDIIAQKNVKVLYAKKFLEYKDIVEVEYSTNFVESDSQVFILRDESGIHFVHFSIEPKTINMASYGGTVSTDLALHGIVTDERGIVIFQFERIVPLRFTENQFQKMRQRPLSITETFPLVPGTYKFSVLLKNTTSKEFTSFEEEISIASSVDKPTISPLLLAFNSARPATPESRARPFLVGQLLFYTQGRQTFLPKDRLHVFFQIDGLSAQDKQQGAIRFTFYKEEVEVSSQTFPLTKYAGGPNVLEIFPLGGFTPGYYSIRVSLINADGAEVISRKKNFEISQLAYLPRPWVYTKSMVDSGVSEIYFILGRQLMNRNDNEGALAWLEKAYQADPKNLSIALCLARIYFLLHRSEDCLNTLAPFSEEGREAFDWLDLMGRSSKELGKCKEAVRYFEQAIVSFGLNIEMLNSLGECYHQLGKKEQALAAWQKSLEIKPDQEDIQKKIQSLNRLD